MRDVESNRGFKLVPQEVAIYDRSPLGSAFVETFIWEPASPAEESLGSLFIVGQIYSSRKKKENAALLAALAAVIKNEYYRNPSREALRSFKLALGRIGATLKEKGYRHEDSFKLSLVVAVVAPPQFFSARLGEGVIFLLRERAIHPIGAPPPLIQNKNAPEYFFRTTTETSIRPGDILILATKEFHKIGPETVRELAAENKLEKFIFEREKEFRNLGLISAKLKEEIPGSSRDPGLPRDGFQRNGRLPARFGSLIRSAFLKRTVTIGLIVVLALTLTIAALLSQKRSDSARARAGRLGEEITALRERTAALVELTNYSEAEAALADWEVKLAELRSLKISKNEYSRLAKEFDEAKIAVGRYEQVPVRVALDLEGNAVGFNPRGLAGDETSLFIFAENTFYKFSPARESGEFTVLPALEGGKTPEIKNLALISNNPQEVIVLSTDFIGRYTNELSVLLADPVLAETLKTIVFKNAFYLLGKETVWRLEIGETSVERWNQGKFFANAKDFAVDGFIYVLEEGRIQKLLNGTRHAELTADPGAERIFTNADLNNIYLLNPGEGIVVVTDKLGNVLRRLRHEELRNARDIVVSNGEKTLWFLKGQKVFSISL